MLWRLGCLGGVSGVDVTLLHEVEEVHEIFVAHDTLPRADDARGSIS